MWNISVILLIYYHSTVMLPRCENKDTVLVHSENTGKINLENKKKMWKKFKCSSNFRYPKSPPTDFEIFSLRWFWFQNSLCKVLFLDQIIHGRSMIKINEKIKLTHLLLFIPSRLIIQILSNSFCLPPTN